MATLESLETKAPLPLTPIRGAGDGMETEEPPKSVEVTSGAQLTKHHIRQSPRKKTVASASPGVLQLGKILTEKAVEVEAVRIFVPKAAITHDIPNKNAKVKSGGHHKGDFLSLSEGVVEPRKELSEVKSVLEKLKNSERRLLQDKEGLSNQLRVQTEVRTAITAFMNTVFVKGWRVMADELTNSRAVLQRQSRDAQSAIQDLLSEREQFRQEMSATQKFLEELLVSLQWGREQTYYPNAQPHSTAELALINHKLAKAVNSHLLGNVGANNQKKISILRILDPVACTENSPDNPFSESSPASLLATKKNIGRFHPYTRYENITFNCCNHCQGELTAL
ncbi:golgin-45 [Echinops telfairi]|uniref:Golgin-45 n=1 Tax=Echinops telfairi TaxID=9371 RepID=A0AC55DQ68_ECHTE|nr:golgin-45 [Echinops telfairi]